MDDFLAAIGFGDINSQHIAAKLLDQENKERRNAVNFENLYPTHGATATLERMEGEGLRVQGVEGLLTNLGRCCNPVPGDAIVGYVTRGRGVTIHRANCPNVMASVRKGSDARLVDVSWAARPESLCSYRRSSSDG